MKKAIIFLILTLLPTLTFGRNAVFMRPHTYTASNHDSKIDARRKATEEAQIELLQELGALVEAQQKMRTITSGNKSQQEFIEELRTYTIGRVQTSVVAGTEDWKNNIYSATFRMVVDTADLRRNLDNILKQREEQRLAETQKQQEIQRLENENRALRTQIQISGQTPPAPQPRPQQTFSPQPAPKILVEQTNEKREYSAYAFTHFKMDLDGGNSVVFGVGIPGNKLGTGNLNVELGKTKGIGLSVGVGAQNKILNISGTLDAGVWKKGTDSTWTEAVFNHYINEYQEIKFERHKWKWGGASARFGIGWDWIRAEAGIYANMGNSVSETDGILDNWWGVEAIDRNFVKIRREFAFWLSWSLGVAFLF